MRASQFCDHRTSNVSCKGAAEDTSAGLATVMLSIFGNTEVATEKPCKILTVATWSILPIGLDLGVSTPVRMSRPTRILQVLDYALESA